MNKMFLWLRSFVKFTEQGQTYSNLCYYIWRPVPVIENVQNLVAILF